MGKGKANTCEHLKNASPDQQQLTVQGPDAFCLAKWLCWTFCVDI